MYKFFLLACSLLLHLGLTAQQFRVTGKVVDDLSGIGLANIAIVDQHHKMATLTNEEGFFTLALPFDSVILLVAPVGYKEIEYRLKPNKDLTIEIRVVKAPLQRKFNDKSYFIIPGSRNSLTQIKMTSKESDRLPQILTNDLLKSSQYLPGFQKIMIGSSIQNIRGTGFDQNMVMFDGVPVYHPYHLLGVYSVFDHVNAQSVTYTKSNFDPRYNGLSSQVAVKSKEVQGVSNGSISYDILFLKASLETKIGDNSVVVGSVRRSYLDALLTGANDSNTIKPVVHDFSVKYIYKFKSGSLLQFNTLQTGDVLKTSEVKTIIDDQGNTRKRDRGLDIGLRNSLYNAQFTRILKGHAVENIQAYYTSFTFKTIYHSKVFVPGVTTPEKAYYLTRQNGIKEIALRYTLNQAKKYNTNLTIGGLVGLQIFDVGTMTYKRNLVDVPTFDSLVFKNRPIFVNTSMFVSGYKPYKGYMLNYTAKATLLTGYATFIYVDPRFTIQKFIDSSSNIEFNYDMTHQPYHVLSENNYGFGFDNLVPSSKFAPVQRMQQITLSYMKKLKTRYVFNSSVFYRHLANQVLLIPGQNSEIASKDWDDKMYKGNGNIVGLELQLKKTEGLTTGWIAYTYTNSRRTFEALNLGEAFPYFTDRNHELDIVVINKIGKRNYFTFCYSVLSGNPITSPTSKYQLPVAPNFSGNWTGQGVSVKGGINNYRTPLSTRVDVAFQFQRSSRLWKESTFHFSIYNMLNQLNAYDVTLKKANNTSNQLTTYATRLFSFVPTLTYIARF